MGIQVHWLEEEMDLEKSTILVAFPGVGDVGKLAIAKTKSIERITNGASALATRCIEIASGSPLTEAEKNATKKSEINTECPSIANPNYVPY